MTTDERIAQVPLTETLTSIAPNYRIFIEEALGTRSMPIGKYCHEAAKIINELQAKLKTAEVALEEIYTSDEVHEIWYQAIAKQALAEIRK